MANEDKNNPQKKRKTGGPEKSAEIDPKTPSSSGGKDSAQPPPSNGEQSTAQPTIDGASPSSANSKTNLSVNDKPAQHISNYNVPAFRILRKLLKGGARAKQNFQTLEQALTENKLPRGLCPKKIPLNIPDVKIKHQLSWEKAHSDLNRTLTEILKEHWQERYKLLQQQYNETLTPLQDRSTREETDHILQLLQKSEEETLEQLRSKNEKKKIPKENTVEKETETTTENNQGSTT